MAAECIKAGKHIHLDKPAGLKLKPVIDLHAEADKRNLTIQMGYMLRYNPAFEFLFQVVKDGWLGEITEINGMMGKRVQDLALKLLKSGYSFGTVIRINQLFLSPIG